MKLEFAIMRRLGDMVQRAPERVQYIDTIIHPAEAYELAYSMQVELRTPPADWATTPSPRLFGLDRDDWRADPSPCVGEFERLKEVG